MRSILLIGMPGCGKSAVGAALAEKLGRPFRDLDALIVERDGRSIPAFFSEEGEEGFRRLEHEILRETVKQSGLVIAAGGGAVTRRDNIELMRRFCRVIWLRRDLDKLPTEGRPLSQTHPLEELYRLREPLYRAAAELVIDNNGTVGQTVEKIMEAL